MKQPSLGDFRNEWRASANGGYGGSEFSLTLAHPQINNAKRRGSSLCFHSFIFFLVEQLFCLKHIIRQNMARGDMPLMAERGIPG